MKVDKHCNTRVIHIVIHMIHIVKRSCQSKRREWLHCQGLNRVGCIGRIRQMALLIAHICFAFFKRLQMLREIWEEEIWVHMYLSSLIGLKIYKFHACVIDCLVFIKRLLLCNVSPKCLCCMCIVQIIASHCLGLCHWNSVCLPRPSLPRIRFVSQRALGVPCVSVSPLCVLSVNHLSGWYRGGKMIE